MNTTAHRVLSSALSQTLRNQLLSFSCFFQVGFLPKWSSVTPKVHISVFALHIPTLILQRSCRPIPPPRHQPSSCPASHSCSRDIHTEPTILLSLHTPQREISPLSVTHLTHFRRHCRMRLSMVTSSAVAVKQLRRTDLQRRSQHLLGFIPWQQTYLELE